MRCSAYWENITLAGVFAVYILLFECNKGARHVICSNRPVLIEWSSEPDLRVAWSLPYYVTYASWLLIYMANGICQRSPGLWITECQSNTQSRLSEGCSCVPFSNSSALAGSHDVKSRPWKKGGGAKSNGRRRQRATDSVQWGDVRQQRSFSIKQFGRSCQ